MPSRKRDYISSISGWSVGNSERARKDAEAIQKVVRGARLPVTNNVERSYIPEAIIADTVAKYFLDHKFADFSIDRECPIQIGPNYYVTDIVLRDSEGSFLAIVECKSLRNANLGTQQLKSFLCATDTPYGIIASSINPDSWVFYENLRHNRFQQITRADFEEQVLANS
ncbi:hypothetical protein C6501_17120 [Candidatus Poribacteria bacterium]|nr:MAG: hypothetical protein C6501_17120 [Candidatus Poribacteria bacterium]